MIADLTAALEREAFMRLVLCDLYPGERARDANWLRLRP